MKKILLIAAVACMAIGCCCKKAESQEGAATCSAQKECVAACVADSVCPLDSTKCCQLDSTACPKAAECKKAECAAKAECPKADCPKAADCKKHAECPKAADCPKK